MNVAFNYNHWYFWENDPPNSFGTQKVVFDGPTKTIFVSEGVTQLNVKEDIYEAWKEWTIISPEQGTAMTWPIAITAIGGDPITNDRNVGTTFFLENGWRIQPFSSQSSYTLTIEGNIYTREVGETPFLFAEGVSTSLVRSNIVDLIRVEALGVNITNNDIQAIRDSVWQAVLSNYGTKGTAGHKLDKVATKTQDIALR